MRQKILCSECIFWQRDISTDTSVVQGEHVVLVHKLVLIIAQGLDLSLKRTRQIGTAQDHQVQVVVVAKTFGCPWGRPRVRWGGLFGYDSFNEAVGTIGEGVAMFTDWTMNEAQMLEMEKRSIKKCNWLHDVRLSDVGKLSRNVLAGGGVALSVYQTLIC